MRTLAIAALSLWPVMASATFMGGNEIHEACQKWPQFTDGYASGVIDSILTLARDNHTPFGLCIPANTEIQQASAVLCRYLEHHPEKRQYSASSLAFNAFQDVWACSN